MTAQYTIGLDYARTPFGTYRQRRQWRGGGRGRLELCARNQGVILSRDPNLARQHPMDYVTAPKPPQAGAGAARKSVKGFKLEQVVGIGVDTTGSTPLPVDANGQPLAFQKKFANHPAAMAWLWKDHTGSRKPPKSQPWPERSVRNIWPGVWHLFERMVF